MKNVPETGNESSTAYSSLMHTDLKLEMALEIWRVNTTPFWNF
jgi:hypothetical protein